MSSPVLHLPSPALILPLLVNKFPNKLALDPNIYFRIVVYVANAAAVNSNGIKTLLANGLSTFPIKDNPFFSNGPKSLPKNPPDCLILCSLVFDNFIFADEPFAKTLRTLETFILVNNNLCRKFFSSIESPTTFEESHFSISFYSRFLIY